MGEKVTWIGDGGEKGRTRKRQDKKVKEVKTEREREGLIKGLIKG